MYTNRRSNRTGTSIDFNLESHILWMEQARFNLKFGTLYENPNYSVFIELHYLLTLRENRKWISCRCWNSTRVFPFALFRFLCNGKKLFYPCFLNPVIVRALDDLCDRHCYLCISEAGRDLWLRSMTNIMINYTHTHTFSTATIQSNADECTKTLILWWKRHDFSYYMLRSLLRKLDKIWIGLLTPECKLCCWSLGWWNVIS